MIDIPAALTLGKQAFDIAKGMATISKETAVTLKAMELTQVILELQGQVRDAGLEIDALHREIASLREQLSKKEGLDRYKLVEMEGQSFVYALDMTKAHPEEPMHYICPNCAAEGKLSVLQPGNSRRSLHCRSCSSAYRTRMVMGDAVRAITDDHGWMTR